MELKWEIQDELRKVQMKAPVKTLVWDLLTRARAEDAVIPEAHTPSLTDLETSTCLGRSTVTTYLRALEATGWVVRERPSVADSLGRGRRTQYRLAVGSFDLPTVIKHEKHKRKPRKDEAASDGSGDDLAKRAETGRDGSGAELPRNGGRSGAEPSIGQEMTPDRSRDDPNKEPLTEVLSSSVHHSSSSPPPAGDSTTLPGFEDTAKPAEPEPGSDADPDWVKFWSIYPLKKAKEGARAKWRSALKKATAAEIIAGAERYRDDPGRKPKFTKHPTTWLNQGCWADEPTPTSDGDWRDVSGQDHSAWTKRTGPQNNPDTTGTGWNRKGTKQ